MEYEDRGRLKWTGFYLSDHTEKMDQAKAQRGNHNRAKEQMTPEEISTVLNIAIIKNQLVSIQKEERDMEGSYPDDIVGKISGCDELGIYIDRQKVHYDEIRNITFYETKKWSQL